MLNSMLNVIGMGGSDAPATPAQPAFTNDEDSDYEISCNRVILALGQSPDVAVFPEGTEVRESANLLGVLETPVFAIGDLASQDGTVTAAIGSGRRAATSRPHEDRSAGRPHPARNGRVSQDGS